MLESLSCLFNCVVTLIVHISSLSDILQIFLRCSLFTPFGFDACVADNPAYGFDIYLGLYQYSCKAGSSKSNPNNSHISPSRGLRASLLPIAVAYLDCTSLSLNLYAINSSSKQILTLARLACIRSS